MAGASLIGGVRSIFFQLFPRRKNGPSRLCACGYRSIKAEDFAIRIARRELVLVVRAVRFSEFDKALAFLKADGTSIF
jgi:hypothetical protein